MEKREINTVRMILTRSNLTERQVRVLTVMLNEFSPQIALGFRDDVPDQDLGVILTMPDGQRWFFAYETGERPFCLGRASVAIEDREAETQPRGSVAAAVGEAVADRGEKS